MIELEGEAFVTETREWDNLKLVIDPGLAETIDRKLISEDDIREAVWLAESTGDKFICDDGSEQCCLVRPVLTYWARYRKVSDNTFEILDAYYHRMRFDLAFS